jgi:fatty-acyl-CoA synthase
MSLPLTPVRFLYRAADLYPDVVGVVSESRQLTWSEFTARCERLARALQVAGVSPGDRVAYLSFNTNQLLEGYYGVPLARAVAMPLNVRLSCPELTGILRHAEAKVLLYEAEFWPYLEIFRTNCPSVTHYIGLGDEYEQFIQTGEAGAIPYEDIDETSIAELFYTSGSTGTPKGVMLSHRTLYLHGLNVATLYTEPETMVDLHTIPLFHANGWGHAHASVMLGVKQVMVRRFEPAAVLRLIAEHRATDMCLVPTMANALLNSPALSSSDISSMRTIMIGGAASSPELIERMDRAFVNARVFAGYGLTETSPVLSAARSKRVSEEVSEERKLFRRSMAGWAVPGIELSVVDNDLRPVPRDGVSIGEVVTRGDHIMSGYYRDPVGTEAVMKGGWFHTGDMAVWDSEGYVQIVDRRKEIIVSGGENISSLEVERAIFAHPEVFECAVVPAPDPQWGEVPAAIVMRKSGSNLTQEDLLAFLEGRLGRFKMPRLIEFTNEPLPKTGTGKIRKLDLKDRFWAGRSRRVGE